VFKGDVFVLMLKIHCWPVSGAGAALWNYSSEDECREILIPCSEGWISKVQYKYEMRMAGIAVSPPHLGC
jgi:hypothetical protein